MKNKEEIFDDIIRTALDNVPTTYNPLHWEMMMGKLDVLDTQDKNFDANIAKNVAAIQPPFNPESWNTFASKLEDDNKINDDFDNNIASRIKTSEPLFNPEHWNSFASQLDEDNKKESDFDDAIAARLIKTEPKYNPAHWDKMSKILDEHFTWYGKLVRFKVVELAVLLLAVLSAINIMETYFAPVPMRHQRNPDIKQYVPVPKDSLNVFAVISPKISNVKLSELNDGENNKTNKNELVFESSHTATANDNANFNEVLFNYATKNDNKTTSSIENKTSDILENKNAVADLKVLNLQAQIESKISLLEINNRPDADALGSDIKQQQADIALNSEAQAMPVLKINTLNADAIVLNNNLEVSTVHITLADSKTKKHWQLGVQLSGNADFVNTSFFNSKNQELTNSDVTNSVSGGVTLSYALKNTELEGGILYGAKSYAPPQVLHTTGSFYTGYTSNKITEVDLRFLSTTLGVRQKLWENKRIGIFARLGATLHSAVSVFEKRDTKSTTTNIDPANYAVSIRSNEVLPYYENSSNTKFITGDLSLGIAYKLNSKWSTFLQTSYHHHISDAGIGSLNDHLKSLALDAGLKIKL